MVDTSRMQNKSGLIFHIIKGSFVDGYGIRTTIFLKGCPLRCVWCCNPEGQENYPEIKLTPIQCNGCGKCVQVCPTDAIHQHMPGNGEIEIDRTLCTNCGNCIDVCNTEALDYFGKYVSVDELFDIIKKDEQFYRASGGGVTIGGGEPTFQPVFTYEFLRKCKENYIHTAVDTCGYTLTNEGFKVLEEADLLLFDLKGMDPKEHLKNTGVSNEPILRNLKRLDAMGKAIIIRVPVIPGYTDSAQNIKETTEFLSKLKSVERVDLLAYHEYGAVKYGQLGRVFELDVQPPDEGYLNDIRETFKRYGLKVQLGG